MDADDDRCRRNHCVADLGWRTRRRQVDALAAAQRSRGRGGGGMTTTTTTTFVGSEEEREVKLDELNSPSEFN